MNATQNATSADQLGRRAKTLFSEALRFGGDLLQSASAASMLSARNLPRITLPRSRDCTCADCSAKDCGCGCGCRIPETHCPPRCVCKMRLAAMTGQEVTARIRIANDAHEARTFSITSIPFYAGMDQAAFAFAPSALTIGPGDSALALGTLTIPTSFPKGSYASEILVTGVYEQCVEVCLEVGCEDICHATCVVTEPERRYRIRAHHWYDHFQCIESCGPERDRPETRRAVAP